MTDPRPIGTITPYGTIIAIGYPGERYYWLEDDKGGIAMLPADVVEIAIEKNR